jgi:hypothetical protein
VKYLPTALISNYLKSKVMTANLTIPNLRLRIVVKGSKGHIAVIRFNCRNVRLCF